MSTEVAPAAVAAPAQASVIPAPLGMRKNGKLLVQSHQKRLMVHGRNLTGSSGKQWHEPKKAFRPKAGNNSYEKRAKERQALAAMKAKEKEMKDEKEADRQVRISQHTSNSKLV
jgi:hypothetical protein